MNWLRTVLAIGTVGALLGMGAPQAAPLRLCYEDVEQLPWTKPDGTGLNVELLNRVEALIGEQFVWLAKPWTRCVEEMRSGQVDALVGAADAPDRRAFSVAPQLPNGQANPAAALYMDQVHVFLRAGSGASWDGRTIVSPRGEVVAQRSYMVSDLLRQQGYRVVNNIKSSEDALRLLAAGGADVAVLQGLQAQQLVRNDARFKGRIIEAKQPFLLLGAYLIINRGTYARDPKRIEALWSAISTVRATPDYARLEAATLRQFTGGE